MTGQQASTHPGMKLEKDSGRRESSRSKENS